MSNNKGLKTPNRIGRPSGLPRAGIPTPTSSKAQNALEKSARAAGLSLSNAEKYAKNAVQNLPGLESSPSTPTTTSNGGDDFHVGDRVWISGNKSGIIAYLGETKFAKDEWAGVVLDQAVGKNDGSVHGVRYFQCEPNRGVFIRPDKLSRTPGTSAMGGGDMTSPSDELVSTVQTASQTPHMTPAKRVSQPTASTAPKLTSARLAAMSIKKSMSTSQSSLNRSMQGSVTSLPTDGSMHNLKVGDRVLVGGNKPGTVMYMGPTDFSEGEWCGIELDHAEGKNDGSVAGKHYFDCRPQHGLFAKANRVTRMQPGAAVLPAPTGSSSARRTSLAMKRTGSQESLSSMSTTSTASRSRTTKIVAKPCSKAADVSSANTSLQKALQEKAEHIDQLLKERDLERTELGQLTHKYDKTESHLASMKTEYDLYKEEMEKYIQELEEKIKLFESDRKDLTLRLEEEKRKNEDLEFTIEEAQISHEEKEVMYSEGEQAVTKMATLEKDLATERSKTKAMEQKLDTTKTQCLQLKLKVKDAEDTSLAYLDQIEELTHKISTIEGKSQGDFETRLLDKVSKIEELESRLSEKEKTLKQTQTHLEKYSSESQSQLANFNSKIEEMESERTQKEWRIKELENLLENSTSKDSTQLRRLQEKVTDLMQEVAKSNTVNNELHVQVNDLKNDLADVQKVVDTWKEKCQQLEEEKQKLEAEEIELRFNLSQATNQLTDAREQLTERDRCLQEFRAALNDSTREVGKLRLELQAQREDLDHTVLQLTSKHQRELEALAQQLSSKTEEVERLTREVSDVNRKYSDQLSAVQASHDATVKDLRDNLAMKAVEVQQHVSAQNEAMAEVEQLTARLAKVKEERERLQASLAELQNSHDLLVQQQQHQQRVGNEELNIGKTDTEKELRQLADEKEELEAAVTRMTRERDTALRQCDELQEESKLLRDKHRQENEKLVEARKEVSTLQQHLQQLRQDFDTQMASLRVEEQRMSQNMQDQAIQIKESEQRLKVIMSERDLLKTQVTALKNKEKERDEVDEQQKKLTAQIEELQHRVKTQSRLKAEYDVQKAKNEVMLKLVDQKDEEVKSLQQQLISLDAESAALRLSMQNMNNVQQKNEMLALKVKELSQEITLLSQTKHSPVKATSAKLDSPSHRDSEGQVNFLNSIIVELQRKNEELTLRLVAMESGGSNGADDSFELNEEAMRNPAPPRLFCDICEIFDAHDTEDCPTQSESVSPPASKHHGERNQSRPYCDICEMFGHTTEACDDNETF